MSSNDLLESALKSIDAKVQLLKMDGLTLTDENILKKDRLGLVWCEPKALGGTSSTQHRKTRARRAYTTLQIADEHLFLVALLVFSPTQCAEGSFQDVIESLRGLSNYEPYHVSLGSTAKRFFESTAAEKGFSRSPGYLSFMEAVFPESSNDHTTSPGDSSAENISPLTQQTAEPSVLQGQRANSDDAVRTDGAATPFSLENASARPMGNPSPMPSMAIIV